MKKANFTQKDLSCRKDTRSSFYAEEPTACCTRNGFSHFFKVLSLVFLFVGYGSIQSFAQCPITADIECSADATNANAITAASAALMGMIGPCTIMATSAVDIIPNTYAGSECVAGGIIAVYGVQIDIMCGGAMSTLNCNVSYNHIGDMTAPVVNTPSGTPAFWACGAGVPANPTAPTGTDGTSCGGAVGVAPTGAFPDITMDACGLRTATWKWTLTDACGNTTPVSTSATESFMNSNIVFAGVPAATTVECYDLIVDNGDGTGTINGVAYAVTASAPCITVGGFTVTSAVSAAPACPGSGMATITFTATAVCDATKTNTATTTVTLDDTMAPTLVGACPVTPIEIPVDGTTCTADVSDLTGSITLMDNCDPMPTVMQSIAAGTALVIDGDGGCARPGNAVGPDVSVDLTGMDCDGNTSATLCTVVLRPVDNTLPVINAPATIDVMVMFDGTTCVMGSTTVDATWLLANGVTITEACDPSPVLVCTGCDTYDCEDIGTTDPIMLDVTDCNGNVAAQVNVTLNIVAADNFTAEWTNPGPLCIDRIPYDLTAQYGGMTPACGTWSGDDVTAAGFFSPAAAGVYAVTYTVGQPDCHVEVTRAITVNAAAVADFTNPAVPFACETPDPVMASTIGQGTLPLLDLHTFLATGYTPGGTWTVVSGPGFISNGNLLGIAGCYEITYAVTTNGAGSIGACTDTETFFLSRAEAPDPGFDLAEEVCWDGTAGSISLPTVYNGTTTGFGADTRTYAWTATGGAGAVPTFSDATAQAPTVDIQGAGTFEVCVTETLTYAACGPIPAGTQQCGIQVCHTLTVTSAAASSNPSWAGAGPYCSDDMTDHDLTAFVTGTAGGIFTGAGVNSGASTFNANTAGPGTHAVTYTVTSGGCAAVEVHNIVVNEAAAIAGSVELACATELLSDGDPFVTPIVVSNSATIISQYSAGTFDLSGLWTGNIPSGGSWTLVSAPDPHGFNFPPFLFTSGAVFGEVLYFSDPGCYEVSYSAYPGAAGGCAATSYVYVGQKPVPSVDFPSMFCFNDNLNTGSNGHSESADAYVTSPIYFNATPDPTFTGTRTFSSSDPAVVSFTQTAGASPTSLGEWDININSVGTVAVLMIEEFFGNPALCGGPPGATICQVQTEQIIEVRAVVFEPNTATICSNGKRAIDLGTISTPAGIASGAPFTVQFSGGKLDTNSDGVADVTNGTHLINIEGGDPGQLIIDDQETSWSITVVDNKGCAIFRSGQADKGEPTVASCADVAAVSDAMLCSAVVNYAIPTFDDATCDGLAQAGTLVSGLATGSTFPVGVSIVEYGYTDVEGNTASCSFTVTVTDVESPVMTCPADATVQCSADEIETVHTFFGFLGQGGSAADNCGIDITSLQAIGDNQIGNIVSRTYAILDVNGLPAFCTQIITIDDTIDPVFATCPNNLVYNTHPEECGVYVNWEEPNATDNCAVANVLRTNSTGLGTLALTSGDLFPLGTTLIEYTAYDAATNEVICDFTITVVDLISPEISCPTASAVLQKGTNNACSFDMGSDAFNAVGTDNCSATVLNDYNGTATLNGANFPLGNTTIVWTATDGGGLTATCSMTITVTDDDAPTTATCPADDAVSVDAGVCAAAYTYADPTFDDNCDGAGLAGTLTAGLASGSTFPVGTTTVTYEYTDAAGNGPASCSFTVTVTDDELPIMTCPPAATAQCSADEVPVADNYVEFLGLGGFAVDNCGIDDLFLGLASETLAGNVATRTYLISDVNGNGAFCTQEITITDTTDPEFTNCPTGPVVVGNDPDQCSAKVNWSIPVATDNCPDVVVTHDGAESGTVLAVGSHTATYTATDLAGNTEVCEITIMVMDTQDPLITACAADRDINTDPGVCSGTVPDMTGEIVYIENCTAVVTQVPAAGSTFGTVAGDKVTVTFTVTDASGNTATCTNELTLVDNEAPMAVCASPTVGLDVFGYASVTAFDLASASTDNCSIVSYDIVSGQTDYDCSDVGNSYDVVVKVTDASGNTAECTATVTVTEGAATCDPTLAIFDPCVCSAIPGFFDELVTVNALAGQTWTVVSATGLYSSPGVAIAAGTAMTEGPLGVYELSGIHAGGAGYSVTVENEFGQQLSVANTCYLPEPTLSGVDDFSTACDDPFTVSGGEANGITGEAGTILTVDGSNGFHLEATAAPYSIEIDPSTLVAGIYTVCFAFDAGTAANNDPNDPGCVVTVCEDFEIINPVSGMTCNNLVNVSLDDACCVEITPDMVLEGNIGPDGVFDVVIKDAIGAPLSPANVVCANHIGMDLIVEVIDPCSGQSCWGTLNVEDKLAPEVTCPADITIYCNDDTDPSITGFADVTDCSTWNLTYTDDETFFGNCEDNIRIIVRTFVAIDAHGNESSCTQTITVERPKLADILMPKDVQWTCDNYNTFPNIVDPTALHPFVGDSDPATPICEVVLDENCDDSDADLPFLPPNHTEDNPDFNSTNTVNGGTGCPGFEPFQFPAVNGLDDADVLELTGAGIPTLGGNPFQGVGACMLSVTWDDEIFEICSGSFEILRTWKVRDMCLPVGPDNPRVHVQVIKVLDQKAPTLTGPAEITVNANMPATHPDECRAAFFMPAIGVSDNCSDGWTVEVDHPLGHIDGNGGYVEGLTRGDHQATYTVIDDCGNVATLDIIIHVVDGIAPTVQCDEITTATLSSDGKVTINAEVFDDGTHDNCCLDEFTVRRMSGGSFAPSVTFNCNDINNSPIMVVMQAADCAGNTNSCMVEVIIEDKLQPQVLSCPSPERITCDFYWDNVEVDIALGNNGVLDQFGTPTFQDNCSYTVTPTVNINIDECGEGTITRTWQASDPSGNGPATCTQIIFVDHVSDWVVEFPEDKTVTCTDDVPDFGEPELTNESCELIAVSFEDQIFTSVPDACYKISRTWKVINWCVVGDFVDEEVVEVAENELGLPFPLCDLDGDGDCDDRTFRDSWNSTDRPTAANATDVFGPDTDADTDPWDGYITYEQNIKVIDNVAPVVTCAPQYDVCIDDNSCSADLTVPTPDVQDCSVDVSITATSDLPNFNSNTFSATNVAPGTYTVTFQVMDNCGNSNACQTTVVVSDCKKPTPYCKNGIIVEIMQTGMIEVWANDLNEGSFDNCTAQGDLLISFSADTDDTAVTYDCDQLGFQNVEIWITDEAGNQDFCTTQVQVQDNMNACGSDPLVVVDGGITTEDDEPVALVDVELNGGSQMVTTGDDGQYNFNVTQGADITITPIKDIDPLNGVTTFDLVLITKHILGVKVLDSPYKIIAADINKSETITTFDLVKLRKLILHVDDNFTNNTSWRFVDADYDFVDATNPLGENFPEVKSMNNVPANVSADFIAVKVGDVNGSANPLDITSVDDRNKTDNLVFQVEDAQLENGETYTVNFLAKDFDVLGYQFTLNFDTDALELVDIVPGVATKDNFGFRFVEEGAITASWNEDARRVDNGEVVFSLVVTAKDAAQLSNVLDVNSRYTVAEAYSNNGELLDVAIEFNGAVVEVFELYQNTPNPVSESTVIGFNLPQADAATLTVTDATGRVIQIIEGDYAKGYNQVTIDRKSLGAAGILYYQLETSTNTATKTMLLVE